jgi:hypothetical protein
MFAPPVAKPMPREGASRRVTLRNPAQRGTGFAAHRDWQQEQAGPSRQEITSGPQWDFSRIPLSPPGATPPRSSGPRHPIQAKLKIGAIDDPLEQEADRIADQVMRRPELSIGTAQISRAQPKLHAGAMADPLAREPTAPSPDSFKGRGAPLPAPAREFFEQRFDYDFGGVHLHHGLEAAESARSLGARAYTHGRDIVFGRDEYSPGSARASQLLAHELTHVVQQGAGHGAVQRSPLSDSVKDSWTADPKIESRLARLSQSDVQTAQSDADVDAEIARILAARPDDLWVAQRIRQGRLGQTTGALGPKSGGKPVARPIEAFFFRGSTDRRALVIAGVHGTERQGMEVARRLISDLSSLPQPPGFTTIIVPSLFPDNAATGTMGSRESGATPTNRNFPPPSEDLADATAAGGGTAVDASKSGGKRTRAILPENLLLLELMERFHPERILSIHGTSGPGSAGVFYDRRSLRPDEVQAARDWAKGNAYMQIPPDQQDEPGGQERLEALEERLFQGRLAQMTGQADATDRDLSLKAATQIDTATSSIPGRGGRDMSREKESAATTAANQKARRAHPSISGNIGPKGAIDNATWSGGVPGGVSLGSYAPPRGMSVFTVEPPLNLNSADYPTAQDKVTQANRKIELQSYADAVRTVLLGAP